MLHFPCNKKLTITCKYNASQSVIHWQFPLNSNSLKEKKRKKKQRKLMTYYNMNVLTGWGTFKLSAATPWKV